MGRNLQYSREGTTNLHIEDVSPQLSRIGRHVEVVDVARETQTTDHCLPETSSVYEGRPVCVRRDDGGNRVAQRCLKAVCRNGPAEIELS